MTRRSWFAGPRSLRARKAAAAPRKLRIEPLEDRAVPAAPVLDPIPDQTLTSTQQVKLVPVTAFDPDGDTLTYSAKAAGTAAYFLSTDLGLRAQSSRPTNWGGDGEKWFQGKAGWFFITPTGSLHQWDGTAKQASGPQLAALAPAYFHYPDLVTRPRDGTLASLLDRRLGLTAAANPAPNTLGLGERWMAGTGGKRFFLTPGGELYQVSGSPLGAARSLLAQLDASVADDIRRLTNTTAGRPPVSTIGNVIRVGEAGPSADDFVVQVTASDGTSFNRQTFGVRAVGGAAPVVPDAGPQVLGAGEQKLTLSLGATDPDGDALTYTAQAAGSEAYFLATELVLRAGTRAINWGGEKERWFLSQAGDWHFLKPSGDFHRWDGTNRAASGPQLATLDPAYFYYPDLLTRPQQQDLAYILDQRLGLTPAATPAPNSLALEEKWLAGRDGVRFFLTPDGGFYRQAAGTITWLADLGAGYHKTPDRLYAAPRDRFAADVAADGTLTVTTKPNFLGRFAVRVTASDGVNTTTQVIPVAQSDYVSPAAPRVVGAVATSNRAVTVSFSQPMNNAATDPANYQVTHPGGTTGVTFLGVTAARFIGSDRRAVELTTLSQSDVTYTVAAVNVKDLGGTALAPGGVSNGVLVDPTRATFGGRPPTLADLADADEDGLFDHEEQRGWEVQVKTLNGSVVSRWVTSDPAEADSDGDGLADAQEANLRLDPRDRDSDDDQVTDFAEFNEIFSDAASQDTDGDTLDDNVEFNFFHSSPVEPDTDGDQLLDNVEIVLGNRNPRIADVPKPGIAVGAVDLQLDVRFTATSAAGTRTLDSKTVSSTLTQTDKTEFANTDASSSEYTAKVGYEVGWSASTGEDGFGAEGKFSVEAGYTGQWSSSFTEGSSRETQKAVSESFQSDVEATQEETVQREVLGASIKVGLSLKSLANIAFTIENLQVTAFLQDPAQAGRLVPIATLLPDAGVPNRFTLGPLVPERGPFVFASDQVFPALVQNLMIDPRGLVFKVANYDLTDERGRNFAFSSQDINDRTAPLVIDFGFGDADAGVGGTTERYRVATSGGRVAVDTNGDGAVGAGDRPVVFDPNTGKAVGITISDAMESVIGLTRYDEDATPTSTLSQLELDASYSTRVVNGVERLWRVRGVSKETGNPLRTWTVFTAAGIDVTTDFSDLVLKTQTGLTFKFLQDLDDDGIDAGQEYVLGSSDIKTDSDADGLTDAFEYFGRMPDPANPSVNLTWTVDVTGKDTVRAFSSPARPDSDLDGISDAAEFNRFVDVDTDNDPVTPPVSVRRSLDPRNPDTDGDTLPDGDEKTLGTDPTVDDADKVLDDDADGLVNFVEDDGWDVTRYAVSTAANTQGAATTYHVTSLKNNPDADADGLTDKEERALGTDPNLVDTDGDGVADDAEVTITDNPAGPRTVGLLYNPTDADADNDKRSDGAELTTPILVSVVGQTPYEVSSDPTRADQDNDTLVDGDELTQGTDPKKFDTDGDNAGIGDAREGVLGTNPLRKDQKVTIAVTQIALTGTEAEDGEAGTGDDLEIFGTIRLGKTGSLSDIYSISSASPTSFVIGTVVTFGASQTKSYILNEGEKVTLQNSGFKDFDESSGNDPFDDASKDFNFGDSASSGKITSSGQTGGNGSVSLETSYTFTIEL